MPPLHLITMLVYIISKPTAHGPLILCGGTLFKIKVPPLKFPLLFRHSYVFSYLLDWGLGFYLNLSYFSCLNF